MKDGTIEDFQIIARNDESTAQSLPDRLIKHLREMAEDDGAYKVNRLDHVLQCATRAYEDQASDDWIVAALLHDIGDVLAPYTHGQLAAEIIRPFVTEEVCWTVRHHGIFQMFYNKSLSEEKRNSREQFSNHPFYKSAIDFCENWDQCSFDPNYNIKSIKFFIPTIYRVFNRTPFKQ